ncbi:MAG: hypothetical protein EP335_12540 [Alphaproteobacteria bacterium]|nr:MAG: hypothetical protein EP335_12540 [Alphaproteobacteria bacterium]
MNQSIPPNQIDRFRGWSLAALYAALAVLAALLVFAAYRIWPATGHAELAVFAVALTGSVTVVTGLRTAWQFAKILRANVGVPRLALTPFLFITLTLVSTSYLFSHL